MIFALKPKTALSPANSTSSTVLVCPGSNRTAVPATIFKRNPRAFSRSEEGGLPHHKIGPFSYFDRAKLMSDAMGNRRVDRVFCDIALDAHVIVLGAVTLQGPALDLHFMSCLPGSGDDLTNSAHRLGITRHHRQGAQIMQDILCRDGFAPYARFCEREVFGYRGIEMVANHQHVQMFVQSVDRIGAGRIGRGGEDISFAAHFDNVGSMAAASSFCVIGMYCPPFECGNARLNEPGFV